MMNIAKISCNGQITIPIEVRRKLNIQSEDKVLFLQNEKGEIIIQKLNVATVRNSLVADTQPHIAVG